MRIEELSLSLRPYNALKRAGIHTVEQLERLDDIDLLKMRGLGEKSLYEIRDCLRQAGRTETRETLQNAPRDGKYLHGYREGAEAFRSAFLREMARRIRRTKGSIRAGLQVAAEIAEEMEVTG